ncbi:hypothetical protein ACIQZB_35465 [Streptomyces sp. NPDC097727]|uniref:hypothetical protein n=1 Tax=Streptomyces sp. NPDC097727 TaxID=3366092 RepID=UPI00382ABFB7
MATRFTDPRVEARTFAPLVLDMLVAAGNLKAGCARGARSAVPVPSAAVVGWMCWKPVRSERMA